MAELKMELLGDHIIIEKGKLPANLVNEKSAEYQVPYVDIKAFEKGILERYTDGRKSVLCEDGDILVVWDGARCGFTGKAISGAIGSTLAKITPKPDITRGYLYYFLKSQFPKFNTLVKGIGIPHLNPFIIHHSSLLIPPLPEQHFIVTKIEELFSDLDDGIASIKKVKEQLKVYRQSVLKWAFEGRLTNENVQDGELPKRWKWVRLGEISKNVEYGSASKSKDFGKIPVIRMGNIQNGIIDWNDLKYTDDDLEIKKYLLNINDVLFNRTNSPELVGKTAIYRGERPAIFAGYLIRINLIEELIIAQYLNYFLKSEFAKNYGNTVKTDGVNQSNINGQKLKSYPIPLAPINEQNNIVQEIESRFSLADKLEQSIDESLQQSEALRQSILKRAFEGRLVDSDEL
jgi:type I restriction enzyme S subunit